MLNNNLKKILIMHTTVMVDGLVIKSVPPKAVPVKHDGQIFNIFQWCVAVKNVIFIQQSIQTTITAFGLEAIVTSLVHAGDCNSAENCRQTIQMILDNGNSVVCRKIREMLDKAAGKVSILDTYSLTFCHTTQIHCTWTLSDPF